VVEHGSREESQAGHALAPYHDDRALTARDVELETPTIITGSGVPMGNPFIRRRHRPLTMRVAILTLMACILVTGLLTVTPLGSNADDTLSSFQALSGVVVWHNQVGYQWYLVKWGDTEDSIAHQFGVQIGGIYELNHLFAGEELTAGQSIKVPTDRSYGADYSPPTLGVSTNGNRFGSNWWNSIAGNPPGEAKCGPIGDGTPTGYQLQPPNWGAYWMRGFSVIGTWISHTGVDLAAPFGNTIHAAQTGQVIWAGYDATNGLGWSVKIDHCHHISTVFGHMAQLLVTPGQTVKAGDPIGLEGSTGTSTGPHLHFMVEYDNQYVDPMPYYGDSKSAIAKNPIYG
jgi:hypothetical protein